MTQGRGRKSFFLTKEAMIPGDPKSLNTDVKLKTRWRQVREKGILKMRSMRKNGKGYLILYLEHKSSRGR